MILVLDIEDGRKAPADTSSLLHEPSVCSSALDKPDLSKKQTACHKDHATAG